MRSDTTMMFMLRFFPVAAIILIEVVNIVLNLFAWDRAIFCSSIFVHSTNRAAATHELLQDKAKHEHNHENAAHIHAFTD